jgi:putative tricarboxylic transport membrane protein
MELIAAMFSGVMMGSIIGILPGIGPAMILLAITPLIGAFELITLFTFYSCLISSSQYFGSVSAIVYGVPGEISSIPAVRNGHVLFRQGKGTQALSSTSTASLLGATWGIIIMLITYTNIDNLLWLYDMTVLMSVYLIVMFGMVIYTKKPWVSLICMISGLAMGKIGYDDLFMTHIFVPEHTPLDAGLPFYPIFTGLIIVPELIKYIRETKKLNVSTLHYWPCLKERLKAVFSLPYKNSIIRGSVIGSFMGLIPGASYMLSSNVADKIEKKINNSKLARLLSAESANNSAAITVLLPLFLLGIPIVFSEAIIMSIAETKGFGHTVSFDFVKNHIPTISLVLLLANVISWIFAGVFYSSAIAIYNKFSRYIYHIIITIVIMIIFWAGMSENQLWLGVIVFFIASFVGILIPHEDSKFVLVFAFFLSHNIIDGLYRFYIIYS